MNVQDIILYWEKIIQKIYKTLSIVSDIFIQQFTVFIILECDEMLVMDI